MYSINLHTLIIYIKLSNNPCDTVTDFPIVQFASFGAGVFWANLSQIGGGLLKRVPTGTRMGYILPRPEIGAIIGLCVGVY